MLLGQRMMEEEEVVVVVVPRPNQLEMRRKWVIIHLETRFFVG